MYFKSNTYCHKCRKWDVPLVKNNVKKSKKGVIQSYLCRICTSERTRLYYKNNKERCQEISKKSIKKHKHKQDARLALRQQVLLGKIKRPEKCEECKKNVEKIEGHHEDYSKPLEVKWLCKSCHADYNKRQREEVI